MTRVSYLHKRRSKLRCVYCHGTVGEELACCESCAVTYHPLCHTEHAACPTLGCRHGRQLRPIKAYAPELLLEERRARLAMLGSGLVLLSLSAALVLRLSGGDRLGVALLFITGAALQLLPLLVLKNE